ncbi:MAG: AAC(3) family N-acetyltransferase [Oscillospiraceae bacterium]|nr:AAC(3) family N-acetyltransferase [Oscillospiraceae bacterium]
MDTALTIADIEQDLRNLGIKRGDMLEVHSSLRSLGHVESGAKTVIAALMNVVTQEGALVLPSFKISGGLPLTAEDRAMGMAQKIRILDDEEKNGMGIIPETFRKMPGVLTGTGFKRVSAWGKDADIHAQGYQHLIDNGGRALMIGVDITSMSTMHYVEHCIPEDIKQKMAPTPEARAKYPEDEWIVKSWNMGLVQPSPWLVIQERAYARDYVTDGVIGAAECKLFNVKETITLYQEALLNEPYQLLKLEKPL